MMVDTLKNGISHQFYTSTFEAGSFTCCLVKSNGRSRRGLLDCEICELYWKNQAKQWSIHSKAPSRINLVHQPWKRFLTPSLHCRTKVVACHCIPIMALKIQVHALAKAIPAQQGLIHANDLGTLVVYSGSVEVVNGSVLLRPNGMRHRAIVLWELSSSQDAHIFNTLTCARAHVSREFLVSVDCKTLLQCCPNTRASKEFRQ